MQKLLSMVFLPSVWPVSGFVYSQVQWRLLITCLAASVWQLRQALVTSEPLLNGPCSALNLLWSAVDEPGPGALARTSCAEASAGGEGSAAHVAAVTTPPSISANVNRYAYRREQCPRRLCCVMLLSPRAIFPAPVLS